MRYSFTWLIVAAILLSTTPSAEANLLKKIKSKVNTKSSSTSTSHKAATHTPSSNSSTKSNPHCIKDEVTDRWQTCVNTSNDVMNALRHAQKEADRICQSGMGPFSPVYSPIQSARKKTNRSGQWTYTSTTGKRVYYRDSKSHQNMRDEVDRVEDKILKQCESIILMEAPDSPRDQYTGPGKSTHRSKIKSLWQKEHKDDQVIKVVMDSNHWKRRKARTWNSTIGQWQYTDVSSLKASVVVKKTPKLGIIYPAYVNKNAMKGGKISYGVHTKSGEYRARFIPLNKL